MKLLMVLAVLACASFPQAQDSGRTTVEVAEGARGEWPRADGELGTPHELCAGAARATWEFTRSLSCEWKPIAQSGYSQFKVGHSEGVHLYLARQEAQQTLRIVKRLDDVMAGPTEGCDANVVRIFTPRAAVSRGVFVVESESGFVNYEGSEVDGYERRNLTVCIGSTRGDVPRCTLQVPLYFERWYGRTAEEGGFAAVDGYRVKERERARATAHVRADGKLRLTLTSGSWRLLHGGWYGPPAEFPSTKTMMLSWSDPETPGQARPSP